MGRSFAQSTTSLPHGSADGEFAESLRRAVEHLPACRFMQQQRFERMIEVVSRRLVSVTVVLENLFDTHNCSAVLRSSEGLGLDTIHVVEQPRRFRKHHQILRGADRWVEIQRHSTIETCIEKLSADGFTTWAADVGAGCVPLQEIDVSEPVAIVMGTEKDGLSETAKKLADHRFTIPMYGFTGSFNVSVSAAVALSQTAARRRDNLTRIGDIREERAIRRLTRWLEREVDRRGSARCKSASDLLFDQPSLTKELLE